MFRALPRRKGVDKEIIEARENGRRGRWKELGKLRFCIPN